MKLDKQTVKDAMLLYAVTDSRWATEKSLLEQIEDALKGGATCIQLREKKLNPVSFMEEGFEVKKLCNRYNVPFIVNDSLEIALKVGADGVHIGQSDMELKRVKEIVGDEILVGVSAETVDEAVAAEKGGADYIGVGAVFNTTTKLDADSVSKETLKAICQSVNIPVVAIGGITKENMQELKSTEIDGVALVSAIFASKDIEQECKELKALAQTVVND